MLAIVLDVYEGGKDLIPGWKLKEHAESARAAGGIEGLRRAYEACLTCSGHTSEDTHGQPCADRPRLHGVLLRMIW
jgi:hypothetical protein